MKYKYSTREYKKKSRWRQDFSHPPRLAHPASYTWELGFILGVTQPGPGVKNPPHLAMRLKKRVEIHRYSPTGPS